MVKVCAGAPPRVYDHSSVPWVPLNTSMRVPTGMATRPDPRVEHLPKESVVGEARGRAPRRLHHCRVPSLLYPLSTPLEVPLGEATTMVFMAPEGTTGVCTLKGVSRDVRVERP